ncbi:hypothetical protein SAMN06295974_2818 [Plantibacter flavus]|uniref:Uncharacterized protein n=1 Tax=Plantibacter flavus TaxID=150123 RepID=A0A3N2C5F0_9MICO|nr:hypothetical protein [Plantibacter flavus]ROR82722.1 hypothetical protein EDD42_2816 [Plantibacter flavus]SMG39808.1 hypothetical protein SAMN06295974_2818 [Plantibacter flavus]
MRPLSVRERDLLVALIARGTEHGADRAVAVSDRERWAGQLPGVMVHGMCGCGTCPSIDLTPDSGGRPAPTRQTVLEAITSNACLLLFIEDDRPTYLELAPWGEEPITEFPLVADVEF